MLTAEQEEARLSGVGGSDAPIICGVSKFMAPYELWLIKTRRQEQQDISNSPAVKAGNMLEDAVIKWFEHETGKEITNENRQLRHKQYPWMLANLDGLVKGESAIFEAKTASSARGWGASNENKIPEQYLCQIAHYCAVADVERAYIAVLIRGIDFRHYVYERDLSLEREIIEKERYFWEECVLKDNEPGYN